ncbi:hypothetical protein [Pedobacter flavus]|uniref:DUF2273 domain-containing protein n=1 Tax=Pedobacter flavus TaxID=3113906 RepID=A0ABU7GZR4_9SPHI|nr:hypothetical protein [Pedobacter sp. VNH31]MEE1884490.1 hypothetical protein [Pedobacter sp. VNH31]
MENTEKNYNWLYYVIGLFAGMLVTISITFNILWIIFGGILGLIFGGTFLGKVVQRD